MIEDHLDQGIFIFSWDFELAWGFHDRESLPDRLIEADSRTYLNRIIDILERTGIPTTWATVGHLFLETCSGDEGGCHGSLPTPTPQWYRNDPASNVDDAPLWYAPDIVQRLLACESDQEIGCHTFSHVTGDVREDVLRAELSACQEFAPDDIDSFIAPRHISVPRELLSDTGFSCYRVDRPRGGVGRVARFYIGNTTRELVNPSVESSDLVELPSSVYFFFQPGNQLQRLLPSIKRRWFKGGLDAAVEQKEIFHVWAHPHNFFQNERELIQFEWLMEEVADRVKEGTLEVVTMGALSDRLLERD